MLKGLSGLKLVTNEHETTRIVFRPQMYTNKHRVNSIFFNCVHLRESFGRIQNNLLMLSCIVKTPIHPITATTSHPANCIHTGCL